MTLRRAWLVAALLLYLALACYQLGLPGLHYDEAKEAGLNAMELLTGAPVTAFRGAGIPWDGRTLPLMVQDYIGALNVYLAVPLLALTGIGVPNLRLLPVLTGLVALLLIERAVSEWSAYTAKKGQNAGVLQDFGQGSADLPRSPHTHVRVWRARPRARIIAVLPPTRVACRPPRTRRAGYAGGPCRHDHHPEPHPNYRLEENESVPKMG